MDPVTAAQTFASIVGLLGLFKEDRRADQDATLTEYLEWLRRHDHAQLVGLIEDNAGWNHELKALLEDQHGAIMAKLQTLYEMQASVASQLAEFKPLAAAMAIQSQLSEQAISILRQINRAKAGEFREITFDGGAQYEIWGIQGNLEVDMPDRLFIDDDLEILCRFGLLIPSLDSSGSRVFKITRAGDKLGKESE